MELRNKVREDIDKLDREKDPAEAESRIKVIISMLLLRLQRLQEREGSSRPQGGENVVFP